MLVWSVLRSSAFLFCIEPWLADSFLLWGLSVAWCRASMKFSNSIAGLSSFVPWTEIHRIWTLVVYETRCFQSSRGHNCKMGVWWQHLLVHACFKWSHNVLHFTYLQVDKAWEYLKRAEDVDSPAVRYDVEVKRLQFGTPQRGVYLREPIDTRRPRTVSVTVKPKLPKVGMQPGTWNDVSASE